jgi:hypothetical protein
VKWLAGAMIVRFAVVTPSVHDRKTCLPFSVCGEGALTELLEPTITVREKGACLPAAISQVTDGKGGTATDAVMIRIGLPTVTIASPTTALRWAVGDTVSFSGSATDNQGAEISPSNLTWKLVLKHGACPDCHDHFLQTYSGVNSGSFTHWR